MLSPRDDLIKKCSRNIQSFPKEHSCLREISVELDGYQGVRNVRFSENLACFAFLKHPF